MQSTSHLKALLDDELLHRLAALLASSRRSEADRVAHIGEVDARRLDANEATPSMFAYCLERLHLSEPEAYFRITAARAAREHPVILEMLADGRLHLTGIALLAPHLTRDNRDALLSRATHETKREIEELVAELAPRPDVRPSIRKLPLGRVVSSPAANSVRNKWIRIVWAKWLPVLVRTQPRTERPEVIRVVSRRRRGLPGATAGCDGPHVASPGSRESSPSPPPGTRSRSRPRPSCATSSSGSRP